MSETINVLIVDDVEDTRSNIKTLLSFEKSIRVIGEAANGKEAINLSKRLRPDVVLMDINMPVVDGVEATQCIYEELPDTSVVIMSVQGEQEYLRRAMAAGARDYLVKPFGSDDLVSAILDVVQADRNRRVRKNDTESVSEVGHARKGKVITVFSTKGGVGKTCIAANLAVALQQLTDQKVCLIDLDLQFGDIPVMLDLVPEKTLADVAREETIDSDSVLGCIVDHPSGINVLASSHRPEQAEIITGDHVDAIIRYLRESYDYVVIDTSQALDETVLTALDLSDTILLVVTLDLPTVKNVRLCIEVMDSLNYTPEKLKLVLNRSSQDIGIKIEDLEGSMGRAVDYHVLSDGRLVIPSVNTGIPFVMSHPKARISKSITEIAESLSRDIDLEESSKGPELFKRLRSLGGILGSK